MKFRKMHGFGNDFIVFDIRNGAILPPPDTLKALTDRRTGIGCDQIIVMETPTDNTADVFMRILNAPDLFEAQACGNATRCIASLIMQEYDKDKAIIQTIAGLLRCESVTGDRRMICADMGAPQLDWHAIPLSQACDTLDLQIGIEEAQHPVAVNMGNPHVVFFIDDADSAPVERWGSYIETHPLFPERTNVEFAQIIDDNTIRMRVWERSSGETSACGSAACATIVAAIRRNLITGRKADIILNGGILHLEWRENDEHVLMTGPVSYVFDGVLR